MARAGSGRAGALRHPGARSPSPAGPRWLGQVCVVLPPSCLLTLFRRKCTRHLAGRSEHPVDGALPTVPNGAARSSQPLLGSVAFAVTVHSRCLPPSGRSEGPPWTCGGSSLVGPPRPGPPWGRFREDMGRRGSGRTPSCRRAVRDKQWSVEMEPHALGWEAQCSLGRREGCVSRVSSSYEGQRRASQA